MERQKPELVRVKVVDPATGKAEMRTIRADELEGGKKRFHKNLPPELQQRAVIAHQKVGSIVCPSLDKWLDGFCYDQHPDREIHLWEVMSKLLPEVKTITKLEKVKALQLLVAISVNAVDPGARAGLDDEQIAAVRKLWDEAK
jgi:hypothetical protein